MFPTLTPAQIARITSHGVTRPVTRGEVLIEGGQTDVPFFVLQAGEIEVVRPSGLGDLLVAVLRPAQFTGDVSMILGRPAQMRLSVVESGEVVQLTRDQMHALIQTDAEISEVLMRALIHRRMAMVAQGIGDALLIGSGRSAATLRVREFLTRNGHPFKYLDLDRDADVQGLLDRFHVDRAELPVLLCRGTIVLKRPGNQEIADCLGFNARIDGNHRADCRPRARQACVECGDGTRRQGFTGVMTTAPALRSASRSRSSSCASFACLPERFDGFSRTRFDGTKVVV
jgi:thioredoxin reductase (NADPH)